MPRVATRTILVALLAVLATSAAYADLTTLWVGIDPFAPPPGSKILNTTTSGTIIRTTDPFSGGGGNGIGVDTAGNAIYIARFDVIQEENLTTLAPIGAPVTETPSRFLAEDMTWDPSTSRLWRTSYSFNEIDRIDPATGAIDFSFSVNPAVINGPLGITMDSAGFLWISGFNVPRVEKYTTAGVDTGVGFTPALVAGPGDPGQPEPGGLAFDPLDGTLYIGTGARVWHYTTTGAPLGFFDTPDGRYVDGLEAQTTVTTSAVPEPSALGLLASAISVLAFVKVWKRKRIA